MLVAAMAFTGCGSKEQNGKDNSGLFVIREGGTNGKYGFIDKTGKVVIEPRYDYAEPFSDGLAKVKTNGQTEFIDATGKVAFVSPTNRVGSFGNGFARVYDGGLNGVIDKTGKIVVAPKYFFLESLEDGLRYAISPDNTRCFIDAAGNVVIGNLPYQTARSFSDGLAVVKNNDPETGERRCGYIDKTGKEVIALQYEEADPFEEGLACVMVNEKLGFIDKSGKMVIEPRFDKYYTDDAWLMPLSYGFSEGLAPVAIGRKMGFVDKKGKMVIDTKYDEVCPFSDGLASVKVDEKWGYIDKKGQYVITPQFEWAGSFSEGLAVMRVDRKCGFIDKTGKVVIAPQFVHVYDFSGGLALFYDNFEGFQWKYGTWGYVDKTGKIVYSADCDN